MAYSDLGTRLKELRKNLGKTQEEVARSLGTGRAAYSHLENGRNEPDNEMLSKLSKYYDVTTDYLLGKNQTPKWANDKDSHDLAKFLSDNEGSMNFNGEELTEEQAQQVRVAMTTIFWKNHKHD